MNHAATVSTKPQAVRPPAIPLSELWPWALLGTLLLGVLAFMVGVDGSAISVGPGQFLHDGRHLLAFPCH
jgi:hypothetical protein